MHPDELNRLRRELTDIDRQLLDLIARRQKLSRAIGRSKASMGRGTRDFGREKVVLDRARSQGEALGLPASLAERIMISLTEASLSVQEQDRVARSASGDGQTALIIGGSGKMGRWFVNYLAAQGFDVTVADPTPNVDNVDQVLRWQDTALDHDVIVVATPLDITNDVLLALAERAPRGLVFDVGSLKAPLQEGLKALHAAGTPVTSVHPMFGPQTSLLSGKHVIFCDVGNTSARDHARSLFAATMASCVNLGLDTHDQLIAVVLGLSHATNLVFNEALCRCGVPLEELAQISSTTFDAQIGVASRVAQENHFLYYEIQALNPHQRAVLDAFSGALTELRSAIQGEDPHRFQGLRLRGREATASATHVRVRHRA